MKKSIEGVGCPLDTKHLFCYLNTIQKGLILSTAHVGLYNHVPLTFPGIVDIEGWGPVDVENTGQKLNLFEN